MLLIFISLITSLKSYLINSINPKSIEEIAIIRISEHKLFFNIEFGRYIDRTDSL